MQLLKFKIFEGLEGIRHAISTRHGGVSGLGREDGEWADEISSLNLNIKQDVGDSDENIKENYLRLFEAVGCNDEAYEKAAIAIQEHTDEVAIVEGPLGIENPVEGVDGFISTSVGVPLVVRFADCQGVLAFDPVARIVAAVHSGWRGNVQNIIGKTLKRMISEFGCKPENLLVGVSQSLGPCCGEFSDPINELPKFMHKYIDSDGKVDLWACARDQILDCGILEENLEILGRCTVCEKDDFFSFRRAGGVTAHMAGVIELA